MRHKGSPELQPFVRAVVEHGLPGLLAQATGSTFPNLSQDQLAGLSWPSLSEAEQRVIARILGALDDKIELSRRMNETLEAIARTIFKSWFVDFDPVRGKAVGRDVGLPSGIAGLFPDEFADSDLGAIPRGWRVGRLGDVLTALETGGRPKGGVKDIAVGVPSVGAESIVGLGYFDYGKTRFVPLEFFKAMTKGHVRDADVLLYKDGGRPGEFEPHVTMVGDGFPFDTFCINEHVYRVRTEPGVPQEYLYFWLSSEGAMDEMRNRGTGVAIPGLNSGAVRQLAVLLPGELTLAQFHGRVGKLVRRVLANCNQSRTLAAVRGTLLPRLISGELRVHVARE
jgi:type I restriction enzyme S subunit